MKKFFITLTLIICLLLTYSGCLQSSGAPGRNTVTVMTYNIHHGQGTDGRLDLTLIADVIKNADAEVIGINEVDNNFGPRSDYKNQAEELAEMLGMNYVYGPTISVENSSGPGFYGNLLLSKFPIVQHEIIKLANPANNEPRACINATLAIDGQTVRVMVTHLDHLSEKNRCAQIEDVLLSATNKDNTIIMGDLNSDIDKSSSEESCIGMLLKDFQDSWMLRGYGKKITIQSGARIDYIFVNRDLSGKVKTCHVVRDSQTSVASDHYPLVAEIEL